MAGTLKSMTGFGRGEAEAGGVRVSVELSAVNRRQLDFRMGIPRGLAPLEPRALKLVRKAVFRGSVNATVTVQQSVGPAAGAIHVNMEKATAYVEALREAGRALGLSGDVPVEALLRLPDIFAVDDMTQDLERVWIVLQKALGLALDELLEMRRVEGEVLAADLRKRLARLRNKACQVGKRAPRVVHQYRQALEERIAAMKLSEGPSEEQLAREVAMFADRCDISEERVRLHSHFEQLETLMARADPVGRALDFLCQEMLREINTMGSKSNDAKLSRYVIEMKAELECVREQVQNVE